MNPLFEHSPEWWVAVGTLVGTVWYCIVRPLGKFIMRAVHLAPVLSSADKALARIEAEIAEVKKEVKHNGGGSLKDAVRRIEDAVHAVDAKTDAQTKDLTAQIRSVKATAIQAQRAATRAEKTATQALTLRVDSAPKA